MSTPLHSSFADGGLIDPDDRVAVLGSKGASLVRMTAMGLPVPPGFTLTTAACNRVRRDGWFRDLDDSIARGLAELEHISGRVLGSGSTPLLLSVRSGAPVSMPGMMDTVLNVGMTDEVAAALSAATGDERFGWDTARRFLQSYSTIVLGVSNETMATISSECLGPHDGRALSPDELAAATRRMRVLLGEQGVEIPADPQEQVGAALRAVFASWDSDRARTYRSVENISASIGTAATVQMMTFGNLGRRSGTGVVFTRDPSSGAQGLVGDFLVGAQGEDVVAGTHPTLPVSELRSLWPGVADRLDDAAQRLERELCDLVDIEFTVEDGSLWLLQVRRGKRSPAAALRIAIDLAEDPTFPLERADALDRVAAILADPPTRTDPDRTDGPAAVLARGLAVSPGRAVGRLCTEIDEAIAAGARGEAVVLVRRETAPADIAGMAEACGLVTTLGGLVSHAALIARSWGLPAVVGAADMTVATDGIIVAGEHHPTGVVVTVDGDRGLLLLGSHPAEQIELDEVTTLRRWRRELDLAGSDTTSEAATCPPVAPDAETSVEVATAGSCARILAIKGAASAVTISDVLGCPVDDVTAVLADLQAAGSTQELPGGRLRLVPEALVGVDARYASDAVRLRPVIEPMLDSFHAANDELKQVVSAWQVIENEGSGVPNDHSDAEYDAAVIDRLRRDVHPTIVSIIEVISTAEPRFTRYRTRFEASLSAIDEGDGQMVAHPFRDSYHTVWFELHEELIRLTGRNRAEEAAAGRA